MERRGIPTSYHGYLFRSRLEARWAVFFDTLGVAYRYEPEGYELEGGLRYLPDFWLPSLSLWVEIKPDSSSYDEVAQRKAGGLVKLTRHSVAVLVGDVWTPNTHGVGIAYEDAFDAHYIHYYIEDMNVCSWDNCHYWCRCPGCGAIGFQFMGLANRIHCPCHPTGMDRPRYTTEDCAELRAAFVAARSARFERRR